MNLTKQVAIIGGGPAGLMAAEVLIQGGIQVDLYDAMPSAGRKFLLAGKGGLNLTHSESIERFIARYGMRRDVFEPLLDKFGPVALQTWVHELGITTFVGSSGRVFPDEMKAAPLLRAWLRRLREAGLRIHVRHHWCGWEQLPPPDLPRLCFDTQQGRSLIAGRYARASRCAGCAPAPVQLRIRCGMERLFSQSFCRAAVKVSCALVYRCQWE
jgi:predicted flavoprotein YhiN